MVALFPSLFLPFLDNLLLYCWILLRCCYCTCATVVPHDTLCTGMEHCSWGTPLWKYISRVQCPKNTCTCIMRYKLQMCGIHLNHMLHVHFLMWWIHVIFFSVRAIYSPARRGLFSMLKNSQCNNKRPRTIQGATHLGLMSNGDLQVLAGLLGGADEAVTWGSLTDLRLPYSGGTELIVACHCGHH